MIRHKLLYFFNDQKHLQRFLWCLTVISGLTGLGLMFIPPVWAAGFTCNGPGNTPTANLFEQDTLITQVTNVNGQPYQLPALPANNGGYANGDPFDAGVCPASLGIFGSILCFFRSAIGQSLSSMYCALQVQLAGPLALIIELAIVVLGVAFMTGMTNFTVRDGITALLKLALVWVFATNATYGIGIAYSFFMGLAEQGSQAIIGAGNAANGGLYLSTPDSLLYGMLNEVTQGSTVNTTSGLGPANFLPASLSQRCGLQLITLLIILVFFLPMIAGFLVTLCLQYFMLYARALLGYLTALVLISFLFILSPIFISFALFQITRPLFEQWIKYLTSFSLQMIIVFGFLVMLSLVPLGPFFTEVLSLIRSYDFTPKINNMSQPLIICSVCKYTINLANTLGNGPPPVTCATEKAIPLTLLMVSTDLVQLILSQIVALWIIGSVIKDFMASAPQLASDLTGRLPFATLMGSTTGAANAGAAAIQFEGLDEIDRGIENLGQKISTFNQTPTWKRMAPVVALGGMATLLASSFRGRDDKAKNGGGDTASNAAAASLGAAYAGNAGPADAAPASVSRSIVGVNDSLRGVLAYTSEQSYLQAQDATDAKSAEVQTALKEVERLKSTGSSSDQIKAAVENLKNKRQDYFIAASELYDERGNMKRVFGTSSTQAKAKAKVGGKSAQAKPDTTPKNAFIRSAATLQQPAQDESMTPARDSAAMAEHMRAQIDLRVQDLEMQISVQEHLTPTDAVRIKHARKVLDNATNDLARAQTNDDLDGVLRQLYEVHKSLL